MPISPETYERVALEDVEGHWELDHGCLRRKPGMTLEHNESSRWLTRQLLLQLDDQAFAVDMNATRLRISTDTFYIPDVTVIPRALIRRGFEQRRHRLEVYEDPMPLVVEVWSPSTGEYDVDRK